MNRPVSQSDAERNVLKLMNENTQLIKAMEEYQKQGKMQESTAFGNVLRRNLLAVATDCNLLDFVKSIIPPDGVAALIPTSETGESSATVAPVRASLSSRHRESVEQQKQPHQVQQSNQFVQGGMYQQSGQHSLQNQPSIYASNTQGTYVQPANNSNMNVRNVPTLPYASTAMSYSDVPSYDMAAPQNYQQQQNYLLQQQQHYVMPAASVYANQPINPMNYGYPSNEPQASFGTAAPAVAYQQSYQSNSQLLGSGGAAYNAVNQGYSNAQPSANSYPQQRYSLQPPQYPTTAQGRNRSGRPYGPRQTAPAPQNQYSYGYPPNHQQNK